MNSVVALLGMTVTRVKTALWFHVKPPLPGRILYRTKILPDGWMVWDCISGTWFVKWTTYCQITYHTYLYYAPELFVLLSTLVKYVSFWWVDVQKESHVSKTVRIKDCQVLSSDGHPEHHTHHPPRALEHLRKGVGRFRSWTARRSAENGCLLQDNAQRTQELTGAVATLLRPASHNSRMDGLTLVERLLAVKGSNLFHKSGMLTRLSPQTDGPTAMSNACTQNQWINRNKTKTGYKHGREPGRGYEQNTLYTWWNCQNSKPNISN